MSGAACAGHKDYVGVEAADVRSEVPAVVEAGASLRRAMHVGGDGASEPGDVRRGRKLAGGVRCSLLLEGRR